MSTEDEDILHPEDAGFDDGLCAICGRPTVRPFLGHVEIARGEEHKEPYVCNKCLVDLRGDMATELEVRRQLGNLDSKVQNLETKLWNQTLWFNVALAVGSFLAGLIVALLPG